MITTVSPRRPALILAVLLAAGSASAATPDAVATSEKALYRGAFEAALAPLRADLAAAPTPEARMRLLLQQLRVHQTQRLSGKPSPDEAVALAAVEALTPRVQDPALLALASLRRTTSDYFQRITSDQTPEVMSLQPIYRQAAERLTDPCLRAEAQFFVGLMPQVGDDFVASKVPLALARETAEAGRCDLELSYVLRHQSAELDAAGDKVAARDLMARSLEIRQRVGFQVFAPYSMLSLADAEQAVGEKAAARDHRQEALELARKLDLPAQEAAAREALAKTAS